MKLPILVLILRGLQTQIMVCIAFIIQVINMTKMLEIEMLINARRALWIKELENIMSYLFYCCILYIYEGKI